MFFSSCQKVVDYGLLPSSGGGGGSNNNSIIGDYNFVGLSASTMSTVEVNDNGFALKAVTTTSYDTKNNAGTYKITASQMIITGMSYAINTTMNLKTYVDGALFDNTDLTFDISQPAYSATFPIPKTAKIL